MRREEEGRMLSYFSAPTEVRVEEGLGGIVDLIGGGKKQFGASDMWHGRIIGRCQSPKG